MKVMVIGGTGHVGKFMVPKLIEAGAEVTVVGSGRTLIPENKIWSKAKNIQCNIKNCDEIEHLKLAAPEVVIEMPGNAWNVYQKLKSTAEHIIACGSLWMYGEPKIIPTPEQTQNECLFEAYKKRYSEILSLIEIGRKDGVAFTGIMPPNICGPGKIPLECSGGRSLDIHKEHANGKEVILPDGTDCLIGPCDVEDIADCFVKAVYNRDKAANQIFNVGSEYALTAAEFVKTYGDIYNVKIPIKRNSWQDYISRTDIENWWHFKAHMCPDITKAKMLLGYKPKYTPQQTMSRAVEWMKSNKML